MGAAYNSQDRHPAPRCLPGTRREVLQKIETWVKAGSESTSILWLHGPAGAGKSAIAQTVAETCAGRDELAASFFFARAVATRNALKHLFPTIAVQIALSAPKKRQRLDNILKHDPWIAERAMGSVDLMASLFQQDSVLVHLSRFLVVIDGLDECQGHDDQRRALEQVSHLLNTHYLPFRFLIVSRPEAHLREAFEDPDLADVTEELSLYGDSEAEADVSAYLKREFSRIYNSRRHRDVMEFVPRPWPSKGDIDRLAKNSEGYFIYASTVIRYVDEENFPPVKRLDQILNISNSPVLSESAPFAELDKLYFQILSSCPTSDLPILKRILGFVVDHPGVDMYVIEPLLRLSRGQVKLMLRGLRSLVSFDEWSTVAWIHSNHASFGDFLHDPERSKDYHVDSEECMYTGFCDAFSLGRNMLGISVDGSIESAFRDPKGPSPPPFFMIPEKQLMYLSAGDLEALFEKIIHLSDFIGHCFDRSSRQGQLIEVVCESIATGICQWYPCLHDLDNWLDWERFAALELLLAAVGLHDGVLDSSFLPSFTQLRHWFYRSNT